MRNIISSSVILHEILEFDSGQDSHSSLLIYYFVYCRWILTFQRYPMSLSSPVCLVNGRSVFRQNIGREEIELCCNLTIAGGIQKQMNLLMNL
jgi:hypothetical protein